MHSSRNQTPHQDNCMNESSEQLSSQHSHHIVLSESNTSSTQTPDKIRIPNINYEKENDELLMLRLEELGDSGRNKHKTFEGIPKQWHQTIRIKNPDTQRVKLFFKCKYPGCGSMFKKSCNLRDHFRKHTGMRPFSCQFCHKTFTQSGNLGRHLKNVHDITRDPNEEDMEMVDEQ